MGANPDGQDRNTEMYFFIHNVYANFFKDSLDYFSMHLYPRFEHRVVGSYDNAVEYINKMCQYGRETDRPNLPAIILNPSGDFDLADGNAGGKQLWRFPSLAPGMIKRIFDPIYQDENNLVNVGFIRIQGDIELLMLLNSFYEYCDMRMLFIQVFGGFERWIYPQFFTSFVILPDELINYEYNNPYTGLKYKLDWSSAEAYHKVVKTTARNELVIPCNIKPIYKLTGFNDASTRYGGIDSLADWRLGATIRYELEIPSYLILQSDYMFDQINITIQAGSAYSAYSDYNVPEAMFQKTVLIDRGYDTTSSVDITEPLLIGADATCDETYTADYEFHTRYFHTITSAEAISTVNVEIIIPESITDLDGFIVSSKYGKLDYGDHYVVEDDGDTLVIKVDNVDLEVGMIIELYVYKKTS